MTFPSPINLRLPSQNWSHPMQVALSTVIVCSRNFVRTPITIQMILDWKTCYVRKYYAVQNCAFLYYFMRNFDQFCAQFLSVNQIHNLGCKNRAFPIKIMSDFIVKCAKSRMKSWWKAQLLSNTALYCTTFDCFCYLVLHFHILSWIRLLCLIFSRPLSD